MIVLTREQAAAAVSAAVTERDTIQQNLLELDGSFGKRLLAGAALTGQTRQQWDTASADLTNLWQTYNEYSAVVDKAAELLASARRSGAPQLAAVASLLNEPSVRMPHTTSAMARGDLTRAADVPVKLATAVQDMRRAFARVAKVVSAAEAVWNQTVDRLQQATDDLAGVRQRSQGLGDSSLADVLGLAETDLGQLRDVLNHDPLALWQGGQVDTTRVDRLMARTAAAVSRMSEIAALRDTAGQRISVVAAAVSAARDAHQDAVAAQERATAKIAVAALTAPPDVGVLDSRLAGLDALKATGRWTRLASELDLIEKQAAATAAGCRDSERAATALLDRRDELRGLLDAYQARARRLGAAEDTGLGEQYDRAHALLWTAPCDLAAAADAVTRYQQAVLALPGRGQRL
ncbi:MAG TPA: hypothetical protein VGS19_35745 [Streptosporangiaceae bacterium]|nr:hypothetical protein [Streptosporangiaceae bacterium]